MQIVVTESAYSEITRTGGRLFITLRTQKCCGGATSLVVSPACPSSPDGFDEHVVDGITVYVKLGQRQPPREILIDVQGRHPQVQAYWDGCLWVC
ncbi:MAG: hypothetical protein ACYCTL_09260 [Acidimicrobiales bacterium]